MNRLDALVEKGADRLQEIANRAASNGSGSSRFAQELADDAAFLRKLKPSMIAARARGRAPTNQQPTAGSVSPSAPSAPQLGPRPKRKRGGPNPFLVMGAAFAAGVLLAKVVDWRGHAHPRD
jgi:hypothetical protein